MSYRARSPESPHAAANPFLGLVSYDDKHPLFGRDPDVELILGRLWSSSVTILFAGTGVGKTSFLKAKLVPSLRQTFEPENVAVPDESTRQNPIQALSSSRELVKAGLFTKTGSVIVFDQFEEVFQRLRDPSQFDEFGRQLARLSNDTRANLRLLIAIREEFLSDLTKFDDYVPGMLSNYYRLERLTPRQARLIIESTAALSGVKVSEPHLQRLIIDLCALRQAPPVASDQSRPPLVDTGTEKPQPADAGTPTAGGTAGQATEGSVDPPYLQIVCQRLWECEAPSPEKLLLTSYKPGLAERELGAYCRAKLERLSRSERVVIAHALEHLTGPHEAKKAVPLGELSEAIGKRPDAVGKALGQLALEDVKVLREVPKGSGIYQLYHDMYARILWRWREHQIARQWWRRMGWATLAAAILALAIVWPLFNWATVYNVLGRPEEVASPRQVALVLNARNSLARGVLLRFIGDPAWRGYTKKLETLSALGDNTNAAMQYRLAGLSITGGTISEAKANEAIGDAQYLAASVHVDAPADAAIVAEPEGPVLVVGTSTGVILRWRAGERSTTIPLQVSPSDPSSRRATNSQPTLNFQVLCLNKGGREALAVWVGPGRDSDQSELRLGLFETGSGGLVSETTWDGQGEGVGNGQGTAAPKERAESRELQRYFRMVGACSPEEDGRYVAVSDYQSVRVFDRDRLDQPISLPVARARKLAVMRDAIAVAAEPAKSTAYADWIAQNSDLEISIWQANGLQLPAAARLLLPVRAGLVVRLKDSAVLGMRDNAWRWVGKGSSDVGPKVEIPSPPAPSSSVAIESPLGSTANSNSWPLAYDENADVLLSIDIASRLVFSHLKDSTSRFAMLAVSQIQDPNTTRRLAPASIGSLQKDGTFITLDDSIVRIWKMPIPLVVHMPKTTTEEPANTDGSLSKWPALKGLEATAQKRFGTGGNRVLVRANRCFYYGHTNQQTYEMPEGTIDVVFGPGPDRVTVTTLGELQIIGSQWPEASASVLATCGPEAKRAPGAEWSASTRSARLLHTSDDSSVIVYSTFWVHRLRMDTGWLNRLEDRIYRRTTRWPLVTSVFQPVPLTNLLGNDGKSVRIDGTSQLIDFDAQDKLDRERAAGGFGLDWFRSMTVESCTREERRSVDGRRSANASTWRDRLCDWEQRAGLEAPTAYHR